MEIRVSYGTAIELGLENGEIEESPTTAYLLIDGVESCRGRCTYCRQACEDSKWLSRISWPLHDLDEVIERLHGTDFERICLQSPDIPGYEEKIKKTVGELKDVEKPISLSAPPMEKETLKEIKSSVERIGVGLDASTDRLREEKKLSYDPMIFWSYLGDAVEVYGEGKATAHIIVGLGEDFGELAKVVKKIDQVGADVSLFPYRGEKEKVDIGYYRRAQLVTSLVTDSVSTKRAIDLVSKEPEKALDLVDEEEVFQTRGCPGCNRPYYTSSPGEEHRNYPRSPDQVELERIRKTIIGDDV